jgi:hypothetical protein
MTNILERIRDWKVPTHITLSGQLIFSSSRNLIRSNIVAFLDPNHAHPPDPLSWPPTLPLASGNNWVGLLWWAAVLHQKLEAPSNFNFLQDTPTDAPPIFDICSVECESHLEAEQRAIVCALAYIDGVLGWTPGDTNYICFVSTTSCRITTYELASG